MLRVFFLIFIFFLSSQVNANNKNQIINKLKNTSNLNFDFEQNVNGKIEFGNCTIQYPKKIFCEYNEKNKVMVSNGKTLIVKSKSIYYRYSMKKTPLNFILDKNFLINKINNSNEQYISDSVIKITIKEDDQIIEIFFNVSDYNLIGWQTKDIYQNSILTLLYSIKTNLEIDEKIFKTYSQN